tara:strand:- start:12083 stop:12886 length:804 start_codon:yes stop_codon:yes gene_type:complete
VFKNLSTEEALLSWVKKVKLECQSTYPIPVATHPDYRLSIAVDIGANIGGFCVTNSNKFDKIYAFEPYGPNIDVLKHILETMKTKNVAIFKKAVHSESGIRLSLKAESFNCSGDITCIEDDGLLDVGESCDTISLSDIMKELEIEKINYLKMDCEGSEYSILEVFDDMEKIDIMCLELHGTYGMDRKASLVRKIEETHDVLYPAHWHNNPDVHGWIRLDINKLQNEESYKEDQFFEKTHNILCVSRKYNYRDLFSERHFLEKQRDAT